MNYRLSRDDLKKLLMEVYQLGASSPFDLAESIVESVIEDQLADKADKRISGYSYVSTTMGSGMSSTITDNNIIVDFNSFEQ